VVTPARAVAATALAGLLSGCTPDLTDTTSTVSSPRLLATQGTPAEVPTGASFALQALYVGPDGPADAGAIGWAECLLQKPLGDPGSVNPACAAAGRAGLVPIGHGPAVRGPVPSNACELFGPASPPPAAGQPAARPTDPDSTGGYYLPVRVAPAPSADSVAFERLLCQPSGVTESVFTAYQNGYVPNENPIVGSLSMVREGGAPTTIAPDSPGSAPATVATGGVVTFSVEWPTCPTTPVACGGAETFLLIDPTTSDITTARESMVVSWYASAGTFDLDRVGREGTDMATNVVNTWTAPTARGGAVHIWVVLRDARGGVGWQSYTVVAS
jgi:hypothetical protein